MSLRRIAAATAASLVCIISWCAYTMPSDAEIDRQISCYASSYTGDNCGTA